MEPCSLLQSHTVSSHLIGWPPLRRPIETDLTLIHVIYITYYIWIAIFLFCLFPGPPLTTYWPRRTHSPCYDQKHRRNVWISRRFTFPFLILSRLRVSHFDGKAPIHKYCICLICKLTCCRSNYLISAGPFLCWHLDLCPIPCLLMFLLKTCVSGDGDSQTYSDWTLVNYSRT